MQVLLPMVEFITFLRCKIDNKTQASLNAHSQNFRAIDQIYLKFTTKQLTNLRVQVRKLLDRRCYRSPFHREP